MLPNHNSSNNNAHSSHNVNLAWTMVQNAEASESLITAVESMENAVVELQTGIKSMKHQLQSSTAPEDQVSLGNQLQEMEKVLASVLSARLAILLKIEANVSDITKLVNNLDAPPLPMHKNS